VARASVSSFSFRNVGAPSLRKLREGRAPTGVLIPGRSNASATRPLRSFCWADECVRRYVNNID